MSADRVTYLDSSAIVKLVVAEPESKPLRRYLRKRGLHASSAIAVTEVGRALLPFGAEVVHAGHAALARIDLVRVGERVLDDAAALRPMELRSLDAIHLATALRFGDELGELVTYDARLAAAAAHHGVEVSAPR